MRPFFFDQMKKTLFTLLLLLPVSLAWAQYLDTKTLIEKCFEYSHEKKRNSRFKGQILKDRRNGMGFILYTGGDFFAGDFYRGEISGYGMLITTDEVINCKGCKTYIGNWKDGKKNGFGRCYSADGKIIYQGQFSEDKPVGNYPSDNVNQIKEMSSLQSPGGDIFLGELKDGKPNGFGVILFGNGDMWQSSFKDGEKKGIGLYQTYEGEWQTMNVKGEQCDVVSSSENYRSLEATRKANAADALAVSAGYFSDAAKMTAELAEEIRKRREEEEARKAAAAAVAASQNVTVIEEDASYDVTDVNTGSGSSRKKSRIKMCSVCVGNGNCSGKNHCHGTKKCAYCQGDGYFIANGNYVKCSVCNSSGKCKFCKGTGKCTKCGGSGKVT